VSDFTTELGKVLKYGAGYTHEDFHARMVENPNEAVPALVYADWLDENSRPALAEVIRSHIAEHGKIQVLSSKAKDYILGEKEIEPGGVHFSYGLMGGGDGVLRNGPYVTHRSAADPDKYFSWYYPLDDDNISRLARSVKAEGAVTHPVMDGYLRRAEGPK
jgi:uncharacterized protein (TIGR02996 family)